MKIDNSFETKMRILNQIMNPQTDTDSRSGPNLFGIEPLSPAYGAVYMSEKDAQEALDAGKDFSTPMSGYISKHDLLEKGVKEIGCRYGKRLEKKTVLKVR